jgi:hypothetical protein
VDVKLHTLARAAFLAIALAAVAPAVWWLATLIPDSVGADSDPDYMLQPLNLATGVAPIVGIGSLILVAAGLAVLAHAIRSGTLRGGWIGVLAPLAACAAYTGAAYSVMTAPVIGANIGGGLAAIGALPFGIAMATVSAVLGRRLARDTHHDQPARTIHHR